MPAIGPVPFLGMLLADLGADIIRIDRLTNDNPLAAGAMGPFGPMGRGRRSLPLDLRAPGATDAALAVIDDADLLIEGFRPGVMERLGLGPDVVMSRNPQIVYGRMTGWGQDGPLAPRAGHDINYLAVSGLLNGIGEAGKRPVPAGNYIADLGGGAMMLAVGLMAALLNSRQSGTGQVIDAAMTEGAAYIGTFTAIMSAHGMWSQERGTNMLDGGAPNYRCYECADGKYLAIGALEPQFWAAVVDVLGLDPTTVGSPYDSRDWPRLTETLTTIFASRTRDEWDEVFRDRDACISPVLDMNEASTYPHNTARGTYVDIDGVTVAGPVPRFSESQTAPGAPTFADSANAETILRTHGLSDTQIDALRTSGAIH
jgi:alpha-methylacyl-CoA racemase